MAKYIYLLLALLILGGGYIGYGKYREIEEEKILAEAEKLKEEKLKEEEKKLIAKALNGDAKTLTEVGYAFKKNSDYKNAKKYFRLAAEKGNVNGMVGFAKLWREINSRDRYSAKALKQQEVNDGREVVIWLEKAHSNGAKFNNAELTQTQIILSSAISYAGSSQAYEESIELLKKAYLSGYEIKKVANKIAYIYSRTHLEGWPKSDKAAAWYDRVGEKDKVRQVFNEGWKHFQKRLEEIEKLKNQGISTSEDTQILVSESYFKNLIKASLLGESEAIKLVQKIKTDGDPDLKSILKLVTLLINTEGIIPKLED